MDISERLLRKLKSNGLDFFVSVPCKLTDSLISLLEQDSEIIYTPVTREEEGVGIAAGAYLAGKKPCIVLQNSGIGNSINAICSLLNYYQIPVIFAVSHRGTEFEKVEAQKPMGEAVKGILASVGIKTYEIYSRNEIDIIDKAVEEAYHTNKSVALLMPHQFWQP